MSIIVANRPLRVDRSSFETNFEKVLNNLSDQAIRWDDTILLPSFEDGLLKAKQVLLKLVNVTSYDEDAFFNLGNVMLCGGHCKGCPDAKPDITETAIKMSKIMAVGGASNNPPAKPGALGMRAAQSGGGGTLTRPRFIGPPEGGL